MLASFPSILFSDFAVDGFHVSVGMCAHMLCERSSREIEDAEDTAHFPRYISFANRTFGYDRYQMWLVSIVLVCIACLASNCSHSVFF